MRIWNQFVLAGVMVLSIANTACETEEPIRTPVGSSNTGNKPPVVTAGDDITVEIPVNYAGLSGTAYDPDGFVSKIDWTKISGPECYSIEDADLGGQYAAYLEEGVYEFEIKATDKQGLFAQDLLRITVSSSFRKHIVTGLLQDTSQSTVAEIPEDVWKNIKWVFVKYHGRCERADFGPRPIIDDSWGGHNYELLPGNKIIIHSQCEQLYLYY